MNRLKAGEFADLVIGSEKNLGELIAHGVLSKSSVIPLVRSSVAAAIRTGTPRPDISSADALKRTLLAAASIAYSTGPSGVYIDGLIRRMGIAEAVKPRVKISKGEPVGALIARGEAQIGFQQLSELKPVNGIEILPLSSDVEEITVFSAALHVKSQAGEAAQALARFIAGPKCTAIIKQTGLEPL
jgi:molybdate transport system substrate-binding protein